MAGDGIVGRLGEVGTPADRAQAPGPQRAADLGVGVALGVQVATQSQVHDPTLQVPTGRAPGPSRLLWMTAGQVDNSATVHTVGRRAHGCSHRARGGTCAP
jgi:hypothetical protein